MGGATAHVLVPEDPIARIVWARDHAVEERVVDVAAGPRAGVR